MRAGNGILDVSIMRAAGNALMTSREEEIMNEDQALKAKLLFTSFSFLRF